MLVKSGDLIPVRPEAANIPWTRRKSQVLNHLHRGAVSFETFVYDTNVGDISRLSAYFNPARWSAYDLNQKFGIQPQNSGPTELDRESFDQHGDPKVQSLCPRLLIYPEKAKTPSPSKEDIYRSIAAFNESQAMREQRQLYYQQQDQQYYAQSNLLHPNHPSQEPVGSRRGSTSSLMATGSSNMSSYGVSRDASRCSSTLTVRTGSTGSASPLQDPFMTSSFNRNTSKSPLTMENDLSDNALQLNVSSMFSNIFKDDVGGVEESAAAWLKRESVNNSNLSAGKDLLAPDNNPCSRRGSSSSMNNLDMGKNTSANTSQSSDLKSKENINTYNLEHVMLPRDMFPLLDNETLV